MKKLLKSARGDIQWPGLVGCLIIAVIAVLFYVVLIQGR